MVEFDNDEECAIPEHKIDVDHDDPSKMRKGSVQDWTDVEQVMVVTGICQPLNVKLLKTTTLRFRRKELKKGENFKTLYIWGRFPFNIW